MGSAAGLLTRGSLPRRLPGLAALRADPVASWRESVSPHSGGTVPDSHRLPLAARLSCRAGAYRDVATLAVSWLRLGSTSGCRSSSGRR